MSNWCLRHRGHGIGVRDPLPQSVLFLPDDWEESPAQNPGLKTQIFPPNNPGFCGKLTEEWTDFALKDGNMI